MATGGEMSRALIQPRTKSHVLGEPGRNERAGSATAAQRSPGIRERELSRSLEVSWVTQSAQRTIARECRQPAHDVFRRRSRPDLGQFCGSECREESEHDNVDGDEMEWCSERLTGEGKGR